VGLRGHRLDLHERLEQHVNFLVSYLGQGFSLQRLQSRLDLRGLEQLGAAHGHRPDGEQGRVDGGHQHAGHQRRHDTRGDNGVPPDPLALGLGKGEDVVWPCTGFLVCGFVVRGFLVRGLLLRGPPVSKPLLPGFPFTGHLACSLLITGILPGGFLPFGLRTGRLHIRALGGGDHSRLPVPGLPRR
jgi:hypothetical protein